MTALRVEATGNKLWLDDVRPMPVRYTHHATTAAEAIRLLQEVSFDEVSLDFDLGIGHGDGHQVASFIEECAYKGLLEPMTLRVHSQNPVGAARIRSALYSATRFWLGRQDGGRDVEQGQEDGSAV